MAAAAATFIKKCEQKTEATQSFLGCVVEGGTLHTCQANVAAKAQVEGNARLEFAAASSFGRFGA